MLPSLFKEKTEDILDFKIYLKLSKSIFDIMYTLTSAAAYVWPQPLQGPAAADLRAAISDGISCRAAPVAQPRMSVSRPEPL